MFSRIGIKLAISALLALGTSGAFAGAFNFQEPGEWTVGDLGSTFQNWEAAETFAFSTTNTAPSASNASPSINSAPGMGVQSPGFVAGSGGYYSFTGPYHIFANIYNHGGSSGVGGAYLSDYGTRVIVQTAATTNPDSETSVFQESIEITHLDGSPIAGGANADLVGVTELFRQEVETPFGLAEQEELLFEFYLPAYSADFRVRFQSAMHSSFQELRIDTLLVAESQIDGDFDGDGDVDGRDFLEWQRGGSPSYLSVGDLAEWQVAYGMGTLMAIRTARPTLRVGARAASPVPEPASPLVVIVGIIMGLSFRSNLTAGDER